MVRLVSADRPEIVCLQELPVWARDSLPDWSGMQCVFDVALRPRLPPPLARVVTQLDNGRFRSLFSGQANAILLAPVLSILERSVLVLNPGGFVGVGKSERRICQIVRLRRPDEATLVVANLHATNIATMAEEQVRCAVARVSELARPGEPIVLAGDFNLTPADIGEFSSAGPAIDHILVRGARVSQLRVWPDERRTVDGILLSDHAPVELDLGDG
jgi:endonuclease/exonuclease/phosphatase family metal-dependent hydrolase